MVQQFPPNCLSLVPQIFILSSLFLCLVHPNCSPIPSLFLLCLFALLLVLSFMFSCLLSMDHSPCSCYLHMIHPNTKPVQILSITNCSMLCRPCPHPSSLAVLDINFCMLHPLLLLASLLAALWYTMTKKTPFECVSFLGC